MGGSNLSFLVCCKTVFLLTATNERFLIKKIQKQLGLNHFRTKRTMQNYYRNNNELLICLQNN